jgi:nickel-type superoxide dismutase maturation protease
VRELLVRVAPLAALLGLLALFIYLATAQLALPWMVSGRSMEPTLRAGDMVIVDLWSYRQRRPREGEIVLFSGAEPASAPMVKRVANRTGSTFWLLGDNLEMSNDSRHFGPVPEERIRGRLVWRYWPLSRAGPVRD